MKSLTEIVRKNFKLLIRSKTSALIVILGPLLVIFLLGVAFDNSNLYALNIGVFSEDYSGLTNEFIQKLEAQQYKITKVNNEELCIQQIKEGILHACIMFPKDLSIDKRTLNNEITFFVDHSKLNLIYIVIETLTNKLSLQSKELSVNLTNVLLEQLEKTRIEVFNAKPVVSELTGDLESISASTNTVKDSFGSLELTFDADLVGVTELRSLLGISSSTNDDLVRSKLGEIRDDVDAAKTAAESEGATQTAFLLGGVKADITDLRQNITTIDVPEAIAYLGKIESNIKLAEEKLDAAFSAREATRGDINGAVEKLSKARTNIGSINTAFTNIDSFIGSIQVNKAEDIVNPINTKIKAITSDTTRLNFLFPSLMVLVIMFMAIMLSTTLVMMEKHSPAYFRNFITPVRDITFVMGTYITSLLIVLLQIIIIILIAAIFFSGEVLPVLATLLPLLLLITTVFTFVGMLIGYIFTSEETGTLAAISVSSLFLLISDLIIPLETMPETVRFIAGFNPFILSSQLLKKVIIFRSSIQLYWFEVSVLLSYALLLFIALMILQRLSKGSFFASVKHKFAKKRLQKKDLKEKETKLLRNKELHIEGTEKNTTQVVSFKERIVQMFGKVRYKAASMREPLKQRFDHKAKIIKNHTDRKNVPKKKRAKKSQHHMKKARSSKH